MYVVAPWPNTLFALDLTKPGGPLKWKFEPNPSPAAKGEACCDWVNRGAVFDSGKIFYNTSMAIPLPSMRVRASSSGIRT
jgi:hypothetical protein